MHGSVSVFLILKPLALIEVAGWVEHFAEALLESEHEVALVEGSVGKLDGTGAVAFAIEPLAGVNGSLVVGNVPAVPFPFPLN